MFLYIILKKYSYLVFLLGFGILYGYFSSTHIGFGDALSFVWTMEMGFDLHTNATSHIGYINMVHLIYIVFPCFSVFEIAGFFSVFFGLCTLLLLYKIILLQTKNWLAALLGMVAFGLSFTFWRQVEVVEVYTYNLAVVGLIFYLVLLGFDKQTSAYNYFIAILFGFSLFIHIKNILLVPALVFAFYHLNQFGIYKTLYQVLVAMGIASVLVILPLITGLNTLGSVLFDDAGVLSKFGSQDFKFYLVSLITHIGYLLYNFHVLVLVMMVGMGRLYKTKFVLFVFFIGAGFPYFGFSLLFNVPDAYVFALIFYLAMAVFLGIGFGYFINTQRIFWIMLVCVFSFASPVFYLASVQVAQSLSILKPLQASKAYKGGLQYLLWPGMRDNVGLIKLSMELKNTHPKPVYFQEMEWNYNLTMKYLEWKKTGS